MFGWFKKNEYPRKPSTKNYWNTVCWVCHEKLTDTDLRSQYLESPHFCSEDCMKKFDETLIESRAKKYYENRKKERRQSPEYMADKLDEIIKLLNEMCKKWPQIAQTVERLTYDR